MNESKHWWDGDLPSGPAIASLLIGAALVGFIISFVIAILT